MPTNTQDRREDFCLSVQKFIDQYADIYAPPTTYKVKVGEHFVIIQKLRLCLDLKKNPRRIVSGKAFFKKDKRIFIYIHSIN